jgi:type II secretory pathway pseudopilin PulG
MMKKGFTSGSEGICELARIETERTRSKTAGFTIIESLVAIAILTTVIMGAMSAVQSGISSYTYSKDQITAFYLAQEAYEQLRNLRDENRLSNRHWLYGISQSSSDPCYFGNACIVDPIITPTPTRCSAPGSCPVLKRDPDSDFFGYYSTWLPTMFRREIVLSYVNDNEVSIVVSVHWNKGVVSRQFSARANLLNW